MTTLYVAPEVLWERITKRIVITPSGCWLWRGATISTGYGCIGTGKKGKSALVHRVAVIVRDGALDDALTVDHMCHNADQACSGGVTCRHRLCVNPEHLDVVTIAVNTQRRMRDHCPKGHSYTPENTKFRKDNGRRICVTCQKANAAKRTKGYGKRGRPSKAAQVALAARHLADTA